MQLAQLAVILAAAVLTPIEGFASPGRSKIASARVPIVKSQNNRNVVVLSSSTAALSLDNVPSLESQRTLNGVQSKIVRALMISFIASMCLALPV